jgi:hypothetical protein
MTDRETLRALSRRIRLIHLLWGDRPLPRPELRREGAYRKAGTTS